MTLSPALRALPTLRVGDRVVYHGSLPKYHGEIYTIAAARPGLGGVPRFDLVPEDPAVSPLWDAGRTSIAPAPSEVTA